MSPLSCARNMLMRICPCPYLYLAQRLLAALMVVEDRCSPAVAALKVSASMKQRGIVIFGTGEYHRVPTVTANRTFIRAVCDSKYDRSLPFRTVAVICSWELHKA